MALKPRHVGPDGLAAAILLGFLGTAGLFYVNIMAAIVDGLVGGLGLSDGAAGRIGSANIYGAAIGGLIAVFLVKRLNWRLLSAACLIGLITIDLASIAIRSADLLLMVRLLHGIIGGLSVGTGLAVIARNANPDKGFGMLLFVQFGLGGLGVLTLPNLVPHYGTAPLFLALAAFSAVTLAMLPFLPDYPPRAPRVAAEVDGPVAWTPFMLAMLAVFFFQAANMALLAYMIRLGVEAGLDRGHVSGALGIATWIALIGPLLVIWLGKSRGRFGPMVCAMLLTLGGNALFHFSHNELIFLLANCLTGITWGFIIPYLFGVAAEFDAAGRTAALAGVVSKLGLASGPAAAAWLLDAGGDFHALINWALGGLALSMLLMLIPAWQLDRRYPIAKTGPMKA